MTTPTDAADKALAIIIQTIRDLARAGAPGRYKVKITVETTCQTTGKTEGGEVTVPDVEDEEQ